MSTVRYYIALYSKILAVHTSTLIMSGSYSFSAYSTVCVEAVEKLGKGGGNFRENLVIMISNHVLL